LFLKSGITEAAAKQDVNGDAAVDEHTLKTNIVDAWVKNEGKMSRLGDGGLVILLIERDLSMRPGGKLWIDDKISGAINV